VVGVGVAVAAVVGVVVGVGVASVVVVGVGVAVAAVVGVVVGVALSDAWWLFNCVNIPEELPTYITEQRFKPITEKLND